MSDVGVTSHHNPASTQPRSEGNLHVFAAPDLELGVHLALLPPELGDGEHAHRDGRVVVVRRTTAPELTKRLVDGGRAGQEITQRTTFRSQK